MKTNHKEQYDVKALKKAALDVYKPPFKYEYGYIFDLDNKTVADGNCRNNGEVTEADGNLLLRVRGWGHIQKITGEHKPEDIQDEIGRLIAEGLTKFWEEEKAKCL